MKVEIVRNLPQDVEANKIYLVESSLNNNFGDKGKRINSISISDEVGKVGNIPLLQSSTTNRLYYSDNQNFFNEIAYLDDINGHYNLLLGTSQFVLRKHSDGFLWTEQNSTILSEKYKECTIRRFTTNFHLSFGIKKVSGPFVLSFKARCPNNGRYSTTQQATLNSGGVINSEWTDCYVAYNNLNTGRYNPYDMNNLVSFTGATNSNPIDICCVKLERGTVSTLYKSETDSVFDDLKNVLSIRPVDWVSKLIEDSGNELNIDRYLSSGFIDIPQEASYVSIRVPNNCAYGVTFYPSTGNTTVSDSVIWMGDDKSNGEQLIRKKDDRWKRMRICFREKGSSSGNRRSELLKLTKQIVIQFTSRLNNINTNDYVLQPTPVFDSSMNYANGTLVFGDNNMNSLGVVLDNRFVRLTR